MDGQPTQEQIKTSIALLMRMMHMHYGKPVILLLDEYDVPMAKASRSYNGQKEYYNEMLDIMSPLISTAIKDNRSLKFAVISGCLKIAKESIFTGTSNFVSDTISDTRLNEYFGFTQSAVDRMRRLKAFGRIPATIPSSVPFLREPLLMYKINLRYCCQAVLLKNL